ncbi:MAG TPA: acyl-CoA dehydrogenase family protein [Mycobacteriales bacterium]|jgi:acyl-CoA dehydrogenase|nr:acyl-CoA dehydrogenase family protein [Mycobacteriales bacterium]
MTAKAALLNPREYDPSHFDPETRRLLRATIDWFEQRGKARLLADYHSHVWYSDFLDFAAKERLFATFLTPTQDAGDDGDKRWDTARIAALSEVLGFYGLNYWYTWQVTILGLGPVWQSGNQAARARAASLLEDGGVCAFGLSERAHGADIYSTDMVLTPVDGAGLRANGSKYYIGNGNVAGLVSVFGRRCDVEGSDGYVFFTVDSRHPAYRLVGNVVPSQMYVSEFELIDYPVGDAEILHAGKAAFDAALNTVNVGKFNLCFGGIGIAEHCMYEAVTHAHNRVLYGKPVTDFPHVRRQLVDAHSRLLAMRLFSDRAIDYFRSANADDRRYLLYNPVTKMKVTTESERVVAILGDVVAAKSFEKDSYLAAASVDVRGLPKLEGTVAVNLALVLKFMPAYLFAAEPYDEVPTRLEPADDTFLFNQGPARGLGAIRFHDWHLAYRSYAHLANVATFIEQAESFASMLASNPPDETQQQDFDLMLGIGELFTVIVYGQLICEQASILEVNDDTVEAIFDVLIRDFATLAVALHGKAASSQAQQAWAVSTVRKPADDPARFARAWQQVQALCGAYEMSA